jgi:hypothetical protein
LKYQQKCRSDRNFSLSRDKPLPSKVTERFNKSINKFTYLGCALSYQGVVVITNKTAKYTKTMGVINNVLKPSLVQKYSKLQN